jgi:hypothetical protein
LSNELNQPGSLPVRQLAVRQLRRMREESAHAAR